MTTERDVAYPAVSENKFDKLTEEAWSILLSGQRLGLDQLCEIAGRPATDSAIRLNTIQELLFYICTDAWRPQSAGAKQALPLIREFLTAQSNDRSAHYLNRVRACAFFLKGCKLELWSAATNDFAAVSRTIEYCGKFVGRSLVSGDNLD